MFLLVNLNLMIVLLNGILDKSCALSMWSQLSSLISHFSAPADDSRPLSVTDTVRCIERLLNDKNYCKRSADKQVKSKDKGKRKLSTLDK
jgi:hypothetical protein